MKTLAEILPEWTTIEKADPTLCFQCLRHWRNILLAESDYTQLPDVPLENKQEWAAYRQKLRDMTKQNSDPKLIVFPTPPK